MRLHMQTGQILPAANQNRSETINQKAQLPAITTRISPHHAPSSFATRADLQFQAVP